VAQSLELVAAPPRRAAAGRLLTALFSGQIGMTPHPIGAELLRRLCRTSARPRAQRFNGGNMQRVDVDRAIRIVHDRYRRSRGTKPAWSAVGTS
jgi:hypothetical protein